MVGLAGGVEGVDLQPPVVGPESCRPDNRGDASRCKVELEHRLGDTRGERAEHVGLRLLGQVETVALNVRIGLVQQVEVVRVAMGNALGKIAGEVHDAIRIRLSTAVHHHSLGDQVAEVDRATTIGTTESDRDVLGAGRRRLEIPEAEHAEPPDKVAVAIATWWAGMRPDRHLHRTPGTLQLICNLHTGCTTTDHEHTAVRQLLRILVIARVDLQHRRISRHQRRHHRHLEGTRRSNDVVGVDRSGRGLHAKATAVAVTPHGRDVNACMDRRFDLFGVVDEVVGNALLPREGIGVHALESETREAIVPRRTVGHERVPTPRTPALGNAIAFEHDVWNPSRAEMLADRNTRMPTADHDHLDLLR